MLLVLAHFFEHGRWSSPAGTDVQGQSLTAEDELFILTQAGLYLLATRGFSAREVRICYERVESLCHSLNRPLVLFSALEGQWRHSLVADKQTATMRIAKRAYSLAQAQNNPALKIGAHRALAVTLYYLGDFENAHLDAVRGVQIWRSGGVQFPVEQVSAPAVVCPCIEALAAWHLGGITSCQPAMGEAISLAKELNDMFGLVVALHYAAFLGYLERDPAKVECLASDVIELSTRHNFAVYSSTGAVCQAWARSVSGGAVDAIPWIEDGIEAYRATGSMLEVPLLLAQKAEALHLADRTSEALEAIGEAEALVERFEARCLFAELHRLRGVFLAALGADEPRIAASLCAAIRTAKEQRSVSLEKRAQATYTEYRRQKARGSGGRGFRLPLC
ncbi:MAG: hypothetical protein WCA06_21040 [Terrimicrobiaceae bacterium]